MKRTKVFTVAIVRDIMDGYFRGEYSFSRMVELLNEEVEKNQKWQLIDFTNHLNTYKGLENIRFDFMLIDYLEK